MWEIGGFLAADQPPGASDSLIVTAGGVIIAAIGALGLLLVELARGRNARRAGSQVPVAEPASAAAKDVELYERTAVLSSRADDSDHRDDMQDRRHEASEDRHEASEHRLSRIERRLGIHDEDGEL